jgi:hypothetical protein
MDAHEEEDDAHLAPCGKRRDELAWEERKSMAELLAEGIGERSKGTVNLVSLWSSLVAIAKGRKGRTASGSDLIRRG